MRFKSSKAGTLQTPALLAIAMSPHPGAAI
jgi:hypothetical protein